MDESVELEGEEGGGGQDEAVGASILFVPLAELLVGNCVLEVELQVNEVESHEQEEGRQGAVDPHCRLRVEVLPVHVLEQQKYDPGGQLDHSHEGAEGSLKVHVPVEASQHSPNDN